MNVSEPWYRFRPKLLESLRDYSWAKLVQDALAGLTVGVVALSLCIGLGIASGVTPAAGLYSGIVGGFIVSALGGTRVQIGGPAGAFVGLVALIGVQYGLPNLLICTMLAGLILFVMGACRLGTLIRFIPHPVTMGFTCGIAITIMSTQVGAFLGLGLKQEPPEFLPKMLALGRALPTLHWQTLVLGLLSLAVVLFWPARLGRRVPGSIVAVGIGMLLTGLCHWPVETIGSKYHGIPAGLPDFALPVFDWRQLGGLIRPALTIALLGAVESLLSAVVADGLIDDRHDSNQELMAQGVANVVTPFFGGIPVTGVLARTATNIRCGAASPVAGVLHAVFLLLVLLVAAPLARLVPLADLANIPLASLAAVLIVVALRMGEWDEFRLLAKRPKSDSMVFLVTFALTVCFDLTVAVEIGMLLAAFLFIRRVADTTQVQAMTEAGTGGSRHVQAVKVPPGVLVYHVFGALLFGAAEKLETIIRRSDGDTRVVILDVTAVTALDGTALNRLEVLLEKLHRHGHHLILSGPHTQPYFTMEKAGFLDAVGADNIAADLPTAVVRAEILIKRPVK